MLGLINLFIHILKTPVLPTVSSDMALLDIAGGYFAHMEFATDSVLKFPFARDVAMLVRKAVERGAFFDEVFETGDNTVTMLDQLGDFSEEVGYIILFELGKVG